VNKNKVVHGMSVTQRINIISQPYGGYIRPKDMIGTKYQSTEDLKEGGCVHSSLIGLSVDYLTRVMIGTDKIKAFGISISGSNYANETENAIKLIQEVKGLDDNSIISAIRLSGYDVLFRAGPMYYNPVNDIVIDEVSIYNVRVLVNRTLEFLKQEKKIVKDGFTFKGGYTNLIKTGDGDILTEDTLWDFKVSKSKPSSKHTLQILVYYLMGLRSIHDYFKDIKYIGIYNPILNCAFKIDVATIPVDIIEEVESKVIGYN
jgi:hypothetical protein